MAAPAQQSLECSPPRDVSAVPLNLDARVQVEPGFLPLSEQVARR